MTSEKHALEKGGFNFYIVVTRSILPGDKTEGHIGVSELLLAAAINGVLFALFSGQPLMIVGLTGPVLVFEEELYKVMNK